MLIIWFWNLQIIRWIAYVFNSNMFTDWFSSWMRYISLKIKIDNTPMKIQAITCLSRVAATLGGMRHKHYKDKNCKCFWVKHILIQRASFTLVLLINRSKISSQSQQVYTSEFGNYHCFMSKNFQENVSIFYIYLHYST